MDQVVLVGPSIEEGRRLLAEADKLELQVEAAFWWFRNDTWKLVLATPLGNTEGSFLLYDRLLRAIEASPDIPNYLFERISLVSPSAGIVTAFELGRNISFNRLIVEEAVGSVYVPGAYFYRFEPKPNRGS